MPNSDVTLARIASTISECSSADTSRCPTSATTHNCSELIAGNRERGSDPEGGIRTHDGSLDILRIDVSAVDNDQVLDSARDEQFTRPNETKITGAQVLALLASESARRTPRGSAQVGCSSRRRHLRPDTQISPT